MGREIGEWIVDPEDKPLIVSAGLHCLAVEAVYGAKPRNEVVIEYQSTKVSAKVRFADFISMCV